MKHFYTSLLIFFMLTQNTHPAEQTNIWHNFRQCQESYIPQIPAPRAVIATKPVEKIITQTSSVPDIIFDDDEDEHSLYEDAIELMKTFPQNQHKEHTKKILEDLKCTDQEGLQNFINEYHKHDLPIRQRFAALFFTTQDNIFPAKIPAYPTIRINTTVGENYRLIFDPYTQQIKYLVVPPHCAPTEPPISITTNNSDEKQPSIATAFVTAEIPTPPATDTAQQLSKSSLNRIKKPHDFLKMIKSYIYFTWGVDMDDVKQKKEAFERLSDFIVGLVAIAAIITYAVTQIPTAA